MKLFELLAAYRAMESLKVEVVPGSKKEPGSVRPAKLPARLMYAITKNERLMEADLKAHDAGYLAILAEAGVKQGEQIPEDKREAADAEYKRMVETEVEYVPYKIKLELLEGVELDAGQMNALYFMIED